jgi:dihydropteroate synthase
LNIPASVLRVGSRIIRFGPPMVMGVINATTDSFSGDGLSGGTRRAVKRGLDMFAAGAEFVDIGGESTRPGADTVPTDEEIRRTTEIVRRLAERYPGRVSIDTMKAEVAGEALEAGASVVNDVNGLRGHGMAEVIAEHDASVIIMHMQGTPKTMQKSPKYEDVVADISAFLEDRIAVAEKAGIRADRIMVDPGIGFGKNLNHNLEILTRLRELRSLGKAIAIGVSRKSFIGKITDRPVDDRLGGSLAAAVLAAANGANVIRVHDVPETAQALQVAWQIIQSD